MSVSARVCVCARACACKGVILPRSMRERSNQNEMMKGAKVSEKHKKSELAVK